MQRFALRKTFMKASKLIPLFLCGFLTAPFPAKAGTNLDLARQLNQAFVEVAENVSPAVVVITVTQKPGASSLESDDYDDGEGTSPFDSRPPGFHRHFQRHFEQVPEEI